MKYASDSQAIRLIYRVTTGPYRWLFYGAVVIAVLAGLYAPVRDGYVAFRQHDILVQQQAIRKEYNDTLEAEVDRYLSKDGIEQSAREDLGMVKPGEKLINVTGVDENGDPVSKDDGAEDKGSDDAGAPGAKDDAGESGAPSTSAEVDRAEQAVYDDTPWHLRLLDSLFAFEPEGVTVQSSNSSED